MLQFLCPKCGSREAAPPSLAGQVVPCKACGQMIIAPGAAGPSVAPGSSGGAGMSTAAATGTAAAAAGAGVGVVLLVVFLIVIVLLVGCGGVVVALLLPAIQSARTAARRVESTNNAKQIMLALHMYHDMYRSFPPAYIADKNGKPMHSWRVLILPFVEEQFLHSQYDFSKPWDSPENMALADRIPRVYRSSLEPDQTGASANQTSYLLFTGSGTAFDKDKAPSFGDLKDGTATTIALVECNKSGVVWTQPTDLDVAQLDFMIRDIKSAQPGQINTAHKDGTVIGMFDGSVRYIPSRVPPTELRKGVMASDGMGPNF